MIQWNDATPDVRVLETEYKRLLGFPSDYVLDGRSLELADWARQWYAENGKPWIYARAVPVELTQSAVRLNGAEFAPKILYQIGRASCRERV